MKKLLTSLSVYLLILSSLFILLTGHALAVSKTWCGCSGSDNLMSDANNWSPAGPVNSQDSLVFPYGTGPGSVANANRNVTDDLGNGFQITTITFSGATSGSQADYVLTGNSIIMLGGVSVTATGGVSPTVSNDLVTGADLTFNAGGNNLTVGGVISGGGNLIKAGLGTVALNGANTFTGTLSINAGSLTAGGATALGATSAGTSVNAGADINFSSCNTSLTVAEPLTLIGDSSNISGDFPTPKLETSANNCTGGSGSFTESYGFNANNSSVNLSGAITLGSDITFASLSQTTLSGALSGSFNINLLAGFAGAMVVNSSSNASNIPNGTYSPPVFSKTLSDSQPANTVLIKGNTAITITGTRGAVTVEGGTLKGTGTVGAISLKSGNLAPGMSPGVLNTGNLIFTGGSYKAELGGTADGQFDQINVTGTVSLGSSTILDISLYGGFTPLKGNSFMIIKNDGNDAVTGTFSGLPEGSTFTSSGYVYKISYVGGDGNDVVITVQSLPSAPNTGFALIKSNPLLALIATLTAAGAIIFLSRRYSKITSSAR